LIYFEAGVPEQPFWHERCVEAVKNEKSPAKGEESGDTV
jgi:hypothetical protein